jgi:hypothetical protein
MRHIRFWLLALMVCLAADAVAQSTTATISGTVRDAQQAVLPGVSVTVRNVDTGLSRAVVTDSSGVYRFAALPIGRYELEAELAGFTRYVRSGLTLALNQEAVIDIALSLATLEETVQVTAESPILNTTNAEVGVRFDSTKVAELPVGNTRDIFSLALQAAGVSQVNSGQSNFASGTNFSVNGMRTRSNNFMIDGQDSNDPSVTGRQQPLNNTDLISEVRLITNQFAAEFGRAAGSVMSVVTKSGTNSFRGSAFVFRNQNDLNARTNLDKAAGRTEAPFLEDTQYGGTLGGPIIRQKTFFFGSYQRWTTDQLGAGQTLNGAPTDAGRQVLQNAVGNLPQIQALLKFLPVAQTPLGRSVSFTYGGNTYSVPIGSLTGSSTIEFRNHQASGRVDHQVGSAGRHILSARYLFNDSITTGGGQVTPPGVTTVSPARQHSFATWWTGILSNTLVNEFRVAYSYLDTETTAADTSSEEIPSIEINELGLLGFNAAATRTAIGLALNLPQWRKNGLLQIQNNLSRTAANHSLKFGVDYRASDIDSFFNPTLRGRLQYTTLQRYVDDVANVAQINKPLPGGSEVVNYNWGDVYFFAQDEWRVSPDFTLSYGVRYELPGNFTDSLVELNDSVVSTAGGDERFRLAPVPERDTNNWQPRLGFNWSPKWGDGMLGTLAGGDKLVVRGGYAKTHDYAFLNIALNIASSFPFVGVLEVPTVQTAPGGPGRPNAFVRLPTLTLTGDPNLITRTVVGDDFRSPSAHQFSFEVQRALASNLALRVGYVGTLGRDLFQTLDGNPRQQYSATRVDPARGVIRLRANAAKSWYNSLQTSLDKRFSNGFSAGVHYTWSQYLDTASEIFNVSSGEVAVAQDSFNIAADKGLSSYDRPHRFTGNVVWELPFYRDQEGFAGKVLGGWQFSTNFTLQSGSPFTVLNGADPTGALSGIDGLVGNAIRPNINTSEDISNMTVAELVAAGGGSLFKPLCGFQSATCPGERVGNVGRNTLRADGYGNIDLGFIKNTRFFEGHNFQIRLEAFNLTNTRNFGVPNSQINSANFLNQWGTDGGGRKIWVALRYTF